MLEHKKRKSRLTTSLIVLFLICLSWSIGYALPEIRETKKIRIQVGKSVILKNPARVTRVSLANPAIADFILISPHEIYITGRAVGNTNMTLWQDKTGYQVYELEVEIDVSRFKQKLHEILPGERGLRVTASNNSITLSGRVSNAINLSEIMALARAYAPEGKVINLVEVGGVQQVMLEVRIAEMQRSLVRRLGINFNYLTPTGEFGISQLGGLTSLGSIISSLGGGLSLDQTISPAVNAMLRFNTGNTTWTTFIDALKGEGLIKILAEPTLIALSGTEAFFLAGGEYPIPVPQGLGTVAIDYKNFGVGLSFTPTVLSSKKINIKVAPEVSELDFSTAVQFSGFVVPGLSTRKAQTVVELADGQSFAIAGLLRDNARDSVEKYPLLGDIPVIGALFRSKHFQKYETELIIIVTPHLVKPLDRAKQSLPTDYYVEPDDLDFYILGLMQGRGKAGDGGVTGELDGKFGHARPGKK